MEITVIINKCSDCYHKDHSGAFTPGGAKSECGHPSIFRDTREYFKQLPDNLKIPDWCPLKHGAAY